MFDIRYMPRNLIKGQLLEDFMAKLTLSQGSSIRVCQVRVKRWQVYVDSASNAKGSGMGIVMVSPKGLRMEKSLKLDFCASNNETKYEAFIVGLRAV